MDRKFAPIPNTLRMQPTTKFKFKFRCTCNIVSGCYSSWLVLHWIENRDQGTSLGSAVLLGKWPVLHLLYITELLPPNLANTSIVVCFCMV
jgi:hypothetical protein